MQETTTLREMAQCLSINEPDATLPEHLDFLSEIAGDLGLDTDPDAPISDADADTVLRDYAREVLGDAEPGDDPDAAYDRYRDAQLGV